MSTTLASLEAKAGFWKRQYQGPSTTPQCVFDLSFGIIAPFLCVCFDPTVFRSDGMMGNGFLSPFRLFGYLEIAVSTAALAYYLGTRRSGTFRQHSMRAIVLISLLTGAAALANPKVMGPPPLEAYVSSEKLVVSVSATDAVFTGSFTFAPTDALRSPPAASPGLGAGMTVEMYIWFPEGSNGEPTVAEFWEAFRKGAFNVLATNAPGREIFDRAVGLKVRVGERELKVGSDIDRFLVIPHQRPNPEAERFISELRESMGEPELRAEQLDEPGFCCLVLWFHNDGKIVRNRTPVTMSYRQPLVPSPRGARFFYMPVFEHAPEGFSTADTNHYSITLVARSCSLAITNGTQTATVDSGCSATFAPQLHQPLRATSNPRPLSSKGGE